jgi:hypothetical protein
MGMLEIMSGNGHDKVELGADGAANKAKFDELLGKKYVLMASVGEGDQKTDKKVTGFDAEKNEVIIEETTTKTETTRIAAQSATVTAIAPVAGG